jgi:hypothetical protein
MTGHRILDSSPTNSSRGAGPISVIVAAGVAPRGIFLAPAVFENLHNKMTLMLPECAMCLQRHKPDRSCSWRPHRPSQKQEEWPPKTRKRSRVFITLSEAAKRVGHSRQYLARNVKRGWVVPDAVVGRVRLFDPRRIDEMKLSWPLYR